MARADFAFPSKSSKEIRRPNSQVSDRSQPKCNDLIERRSVHDLRTLQHLEYVETDEMKNSVDEERLPTQSASGVVDVCMMGKVKKPPKSLLRRRRPGPWTSRRPLLKSLYPRMASELEEFERSRNKCSKDKNFLPSHKNSEPPGIIKFGSNTSKPPLSMRLPTANIIKWKPSVQKKRMQKNPMPSRMTKTAPKQTIEMIQHKDNNRKERQAKTKERIQLAKKKRGELYNAKIKKIEDTLEKKEQKRLSSIRCNEIEMQQTKLLTAIILASATRRWLKNAPVILAECRRKKLLEEAAIKIQTRWKKEMFVRKAFIASTINKKLKLYGWRLKLHARCNRRSLYAKIIRTFLIDVTKHPLSFALYEFRSRILKAQRLTRNFLDCKRARLYALEELWKRVEKKIILSEESKSKRRRHKNALSDITHRKILSKGLAGIVKGAVNHADQQTSSVSSHVQEMTPHGTYRVLCQFHLEDSRRTFKEHIHKKMPSRIHDLCHDDARKLLEGFDNVRLAQYHTVRPFPAFLLYSRYDEFRKKIEDFRNNEEVQLEGASERLEFYKESHKANRYAACGSNTSVINRPTLICKDTDAKIALDFNIRSHCIAEMRQLFHLLDRDSEGFLRRKKLESLFEIQNEETAEPASTIGPVIQFREFIRILQLELNRDLSYSSDLVIHAFNYFAPTEFDRTEGIIRRDLLMEILQLYGDNKWTGGQSASCLNRIGLFSTHVNYKRLVENVHRLWECKS